MASSEIKRSSQPIVDAIAALEGVTITWRASGEWGRIQLGGVTVAGIGASKRESSTEGKGTSVPTVRVQLAAPPDSLPTSLLRGVGDVKAKGDKETNVWVKTEAQAAKMLPLFERIAKAKQDKAKHTEDAS